MLLFIDNSMLCKFMIGIVIMIVVVMIITFVMIIMIIILILTSSYALCTFYQDMYSN